MQIAKTDLSFVQEKELTSFSGIAKWFRDLRNLDQEKENYINSMQKDMKTEYQKLNQETGKRIDVMQKDYVKHGDRVTIRAATGNRLHQGGTFNYPKRLSHEVMNIEKCGHPGVGDNELCR